MFIKQLSVFVENKFGRLESIIDCLSKGGINLRALSLADTEDYGVLRVIVDDAEKANEGADDSYPYRGKWCDIARARCNCCKAGYKTDTNLEERVSFMKDIVQNKPCNHS